MTDCKTKVFCKNCGKRHHTLWHAKASQEADGASSSASSSSESQSKGPKKLFLQVRVLKIQKAWLI